MLKYVKNTRFFRYIDVSQAVEPNHPHGLEFLYRDCKNVSDFFTAKGVHQCLGPAALFTSITGLPIDESGSEAEILTQVIIFINKNKT
jgi:RIO kinase 3